jgi:hypothetical protein
MHRAFSTGSSVRIEGLTGRQAAQSRMVDHGDQLRAVEELLVPVGRTCLDRHARAVLGSHRR